MSKSNNNNKKKIAIALMSTLFCSGNGNKNNTLAMNAMESKVQSPQTIGAVGGAAIRNNQSSKQGLTKNQKLAIVAAVAALVGITAICLTVWGVKKHLDSKGGPDQRKDTEDDSQKGKNPKSGKKNKDKENKEGYDYISEVVKRLTNSNRNSMIKPFNEAVTKIKNCEFSEEEAGQLAEFLMVVKGEKKVLGKGMYGPFLFANNEVYVDLDDGMTYGLYFKISGFEIKKFQGTNQIYALNLNYN